MVSSLTRRVFGVAVTVVVTLILIGAAWPWIVTRLTYQPRNLAESQSAPDAFGYVGEQLRFRTPDGENLHGWLLRSSSAEPRQCVVLFAHGNAGNVSSQAGFMRPFLELGFDAFVFDYRGYGISTGSPSEEGLYTDALAAYDYLVGDAANDRPILVVSHSLGTAVATYLAMHRDAAGLILASPFPSFPDAMAFHASWVPTSLLRWKGARFDSGSRIGSIQTPVMMVAGTQDRLVPSPLSHSLYEAASEPKYWVEVPGGHNAVFRSEQFSDALASFADHLPACGESR